ncbi:hypothetical protein O3P69_006540 [Scylla paramamosain]|uniref:DNA repair protein RAD50 n=1 Tax=Scylla paramamosain TaxID=85552 RepID=A0AAW0U4T5_SCYPA
MSHIKKLAILGVRSFGPDESKVIEFNRPLTLILGQNGCGKTTIIESLKYVTTGDTPPGSGSGSSFVHDPKMAREMKVKGQVKLQFSNVRGKLMTAMRSMEATQKPKKVEVKTITTTIAMRDDSGHVTTIDGKCNDVLASMATYLGVSKAILNNVIFCHQEESNWPLDEGKKVKEKFDAIFSATLYIKTLEAIKKHRKDMMLNIKNMKIHLDLLRQLKEEARRKQTDLEDSEKQERSLIDEKEQIAVEMVPVLKRLKEIARVEDDLVAIKEELAGKNHQLKSLREIQEELRASLTEQFSCSDQELFNMISDFKENLEKAEGQQQRLMSEGWEIDKEMQERQQESACAQRRQGELEAAYATHKRELVWRNTTMADLVREFSLSEFRNVSEFCDQEAEAVLSLLMKHVEQQRADIQTKKKEFEENEAELQTKIDELRSEEAALQYKIKSKSTELSEMNQKIREKKQKLMRTESELSYTNLNTIKEELAQMEEKIQAEEAQVSTKVMVEEIDEEKRKRRELQGNLDEAKRLVSKMTRQAEDRSQLDIHTKERKDLENKIEFLKRKHAEEFEHLLGEMPQDNIKNKVDTCMHSLRKCIAETQESLSSLNKRKAQLDTTIKSLKVQTERKEKEITELENKVNSICGGMDLDRSLVKAKKTKEDLTREKADLASSIGVLKKFQDRLRQKDCCPLCHRDFVAKDEVLSLIEELEEKVSRIPEKLTAVKDKLEDQEKLHDQMIQLQPQRDRAIQVHSELEKIRAQMEEDMKELQSVNQDIENKTELLEMTQSDEETAHSIHGDVTTIENHLKREKQLGVLIEDLQATLGGADGGLSLEEAMAQHGEMEDHHRKTQLRLEELQEKLREHQDRLQGYKNRKLELSRQELELKNKMQEMEKLKEEKTCLEENHKQLEEEIEQAQVEIAPYKYRISEKTKEKTQITKNKENYIDAENKKVNAVLEKHRSAFNTHSSISEYIAGGGKKNLLDIHQKISSLQEKISSLESRKQLLNEENRKLEKEITNHRERKRNLDDEKKIREKEREAKTVQREISSLEERIGGFSLETLTEEKMQLSNRGTSLQTKKSKLEGNLQELEKKISLLKRDLERKEMKEAAYNFKKKMLELKCTEMAVEDANIYHKVLDTAIMRFHREKMKTLNSIVRELWRQTYKGNDIDYIEIRTKDTEAKGADKRQTYDYRVIMVKNDTEMDMRGRCSAGQKVLASLLIRMALAETFSSQCGILALDEPTTNLDRENIDALAMALTEIVNARRNRASSQLIVISHDSNFLEKLAYSSLVDEYIEVTRNEMGLSQITKCRTKEATRV